MAQNSFFVVVFCSIYPKNEEVWGNGFDWRRFYPDIFLDCNITNSFNVACTPQGASTTNLWSPKNNTIKDVCWIGKVFSFVTVVDKEAKRVTCKTQSSILISIIKAIQYIIHTRSKKGSAIKIVLTLLKNSTMSRIHFLGSSVLLVL